MKAAILVEQNAPLIVAEIGIPKLDAGQALVKVKASGICGKQLDEMSGKRGPDPYLPHLLGHEGAGTVVETGAGVRKVKAGDFVVLHWMKGSGAEAAVPAYRWNGAAVNAGRVTTFSEFTVVSENRVTRIPNGIKPEAASLLGCAVTTGLGIVNNDARLKPGQSIAVFGAGGLGLNVVQGAALAGAGLIVAVDIHDHKLARAVAFGATHTLNAREAGFSAALGQWSGGRGFDVTVDTTGHTDVIETAYQATGRAGRTILAGVPHHEKRVTLDTFPLHFGRRIFGSHGGDAKPDADIPRCLELYHGGKLKLDEQITHRFPLDEINRAVETVREGAACRCVIVMP